MRKLFVFQGGLEDSYRNELKIGYDFLRSLEGSSGSDSLNFGDLTESILLEKNIDIIVSNGLTEEWSRILKKMKIISVVVGSSSKYGRLADIVVDYQEQEGNKCFTGAAYSFVSSKNFKQEFLEIIDIIKILDWDTKFWGFRVAYLSCRCLTESIIYRVNQFIKLENVKLVEYLCNCHDSNSVKITAENSFIFADIRLSFEKRLLEKKNICLSEEFIFSLANKKNIPALLEITKDLYLDSRYYYDENFDRNKASIFYQNWVEKAVLGTFDDECYCIFKKSTVTPIGFCTIKYDVSQGASIGLMGLSLEYQGRGLAQTLLNLVFNSLIDKSIDKISVVTQGRNFAAQRLYQRVGFLTKTTEIWYHKWL